MAKTWQLKLKDGRTVAIRPLDIDKEVGLLEPGYREIIEDAYDEKKGNTGLFRVQKEDIIKNLKEILEQVKKKERDVMVADHNGEIVAFSDTTGPNDDEDEVIRAMGRLADMNLARVDLAKILTKKGIRLLTNTWVKSGYRNEGIMKCLRSITFLKWNNKEFYAVLTSKITEKLVEMYKDIADKANMSIEVDYHGGKREIGVLLTKGRGTREKLIEMLSEEFGIEY